MPGKHRATRPSRAEAFFAWLDINGEDVFRRDRLKNSEEWQVDRFEPSLKTGTNRQERLARLRKAAWQAAVVAVFRRQELYQRRQEREDHLNRAQEARKLAASIGNFFNGAWKDLPALGLRGDDLQEIHDPQIARFRRTTCPSSDLTLEQKLDALAAGILIDGSSTQSASAEWESILRAGWDLQSALEKFAADRDHLDLPPSDGTDILGLIFVEHIKAASGKLFSKQFSARQLQLFALSAWHDMRLPLPETRSKKGAEEAWMAKKFSAHGNLPPQKKGQLGI